MTKPPPLPTNYSAAKAALAKCVRLEEVKALADEAAALALCAKMAKDDSLENDAKRIRARAARRGGELLMQVPKAQGQRTDKLRGGTPPKLSRKAVAEKAGLSEDQAKQMLRVANVPEDEFERQVESDNPPTVTQLADQGRSPPITEGNMTIMPLPIAAGATRARARGAPPRRGAARTPPTPPPSRPPS
jgi:hypothetical protein